MGASATFRERRLAKEESSRQQARDDLTSSAQTLIAILTVYVQWFTWYISVGMLFVGYVVVEKKIDQSSLNGISYLVIFTTIFGVLTTVAFCSIAASWAKKVERYSDLARGPGAAYASLALHISRWAPWILAICAAALVAFLIYWGSIAVDGLRPAISQPQQKSAVPPQQQVNR